MSEFIKILLSLSFSGTLLMLLLFLLKRLYKDKISRRWQYYIWLAVALRFLVPFTPDTTLTGFLFTTAGYAIVKESPAYKSAEAGKDVESAVMPEADFIGRNDEAAVLTDAARNPVEIYTWLFFVWSALALVFIIRKITVYQSFMRYLYAGNTEVSDIKILNLLAECEEKRHIGKSVELHRNPLIASPIMTGFLHPCIIIPAIDMSQEELYYIFTHELIHYKRRDMLYKWFIQLVICIHWFNPFVYLLGKEINRACELSCDEAVISPLDNHEKKVYGDILLSAMKTEGSYKNSLASVTLTEGAEQLKERLGAIMDFKKKSKRLTLVTAMLTIIIFICFNLSGAYVRAGDNVDKEFPQGDLSFKQSSQDMKTGKTDMAQETIQRPKAPRVLVNENVYYIFAEDAKESDRPDSAFTEGTSGIVFVKKDGYSSFGPYSSTDEMMSNIDSQCNTAVEKGYLTEDEGHSIMEIAAAIQEDGFPIPEQEPDEKGVTYLYTQSGYYQNSFIIEMGWNYSEKLGLMQSSCGQAKAVLPDGSKMTVCFAEAAKDYMDSGEALAATGELIYRLNNADAYPVIEAPFILDITPVSANKIPAMAEKYYEEDNLVKFSALFTALDKPLQEEYCRKIYNADKIAFFASITGNMDEDLILQYAEQSERDSKVNFFSVILDEMKPGDINAYAEKYYTTGNIARFSTIIKHMAEEELQKYKTRAENDKKSAFYAVIVEATSDE